MVRLVSGVCSALAVAAAFWLSSESAVSQSQAPQVANLVAVTELTSLQDRLDGCAAISIFDVRDGTPLFRGPSDPSVHRLAADPTFELLMGGPGVGNMRSVQRLRRASVDTVEWKYDSVQTRYNVFAIYSGLAVLTNPVRLVMTIAVGGEGQTHLTSVTSPESENYNFHKDEFVTRLKTSHNLPLLLNDQASKGIVALSRDGNVYTADAHNLVALHEPIAVPTITDSHAHEANPDKFIRGDLSPGGRYLLMNQHESATLVILDRVSDEQTTVDVSSWMTMTGGVAFNAGWENAGLLAVHGGDRIVIFQFDPNGDFEPLSNVPVSETLWNNEFAFGGPIRWSGDGTRLIAGINNGPNDFVIYNVGGCGRDLTLANELAACPSSFSNIPGDIVTSNGRLATPEGWRGSCPTPSWWNDPTPVLPRVTPGATADPEQRSYAVLPFADKP